MGFAILSAASSCARPSLFSASGTDLSALSAAISFLICSGGSVNFLVCGSMPDMIIVIFIDTSSYWARLAKPCFRDVDFIIDAVLMSKEAGRPVKVMWTREDDIANGRFRPISTHALKAGFDPSGKLTTWQHRIAVDRVGAYMDPVRYQMAGGKDFIAMMGADLKGYDVPHQLVEQLYRDTGVRTNPLRGISFLANRFATESFIDEIARKRGIDPVKYHL